MTGEVEEKTTWRGSALRELATNALRYWEPRRLIYNAALVLVVVGCFVSGLPQSRAHVGFNLVLVFFVLGVIANVLYCLAYVVDVFVQMSMLREAWVRWRWALFVVGTMTAAVVARFVSMGTFASWNGH